MQQQQKTPNNIYAILNHDEITKTTSATEAQMLQQNHSMQNSNLLGLNSEGLETYIYSSIDL